MPAYTSPDVRNISVGTGYLEFKPEGAGSYSHIGNCPSFKFTMEYETLDHYTPVNGIRVKDYVWTTELNAEIEIEMEELTARNFQMLMLGDIVSNTVTIAVRGPPRGALKYTATNETGPRWHIDLHLVSFGNDGEYEPITSEDFNKITVTGTALAVSGSFGVMTCV